MRRILTALVGVPIIWTLIKLTSPLVWLLLAGVVVAFASWELLSLLKSGGHRVYPAVGLLFSLGALIPFIQPRLDAALPVVAAGGAAIIIGAIRAKDFYDAVDGALCTVFCVVFVGMNLGYLVALRSMTYGAAGGVPGTTGASPLELRFATTPADVLGQDLLILLVFAVWMGDSIAFYFGSRFGKTPLAPRVSPRKTVEGALAGIVATVLIALLASQWFFQRLPVGHALAIGVILGLAGIIGDLAESVIKRAAGAKDSASLLPGHGGMLDRVDSLLLAGPALYYYHRLFLRGVI